MKIILLITLLVSAITTHPARSEAPELDAHLQVLAPLIGERWIGNFRNDPEAPGLIFSWEVILGGHAVRGLRLVPDKNFVGESTFYWDEQQQTVAYVSLTNNGYVSHGTVVLDEGRIVVAGSQTGPNGTKDVRAMFWIDDQGRLNNQLHNFENGKWEPAHSTLFERER
jgi:hypothetical protein